MHSYTKIITLILVIMTMMKIGSSFIKNNVFRNQFKSLNTNNRLSKVLYNNYHATKLMMTSNDISIDALSSNIQIVG